MNTTKINTLLAVDRARQQIRERANDPARYDHRTAAEQLRQLEALERAEAGSTRARVSAFTNVTH